jgi:PAS domain S-box-containing protein
MTSHRPRTIAQTLFRSFQLFSVLWIGGLGLFWLAQLSSHFSTHVRELEARALERNRGELRNQVDQALDYIEFMRGQVDARTRALLRDRVSLAHRAANAFLAANRDRLPPEALADGLRELLRSLSGDRDQPYLFAMSYDGVVQLFPPFPEREGRNELDQLDGEGRAINREMLALAREPGEGFLQYAWVRPGGTEPVHEKLSFVMALEPMGWFIGAGKYLSAMEAAVKEEALRRIESIRFGDGGYVFAGDWRGVSLSGPAKGRNMREVADADGVKVVQELIRLARGDGGWLAYRMPALEGHRSAPKMSYVRGVPEWEWYVGAGVYLDEIEAEVAAEQKLWREALLQTLTITGVFLLLSLGAAIPISRRVSERIGRDFGVFNRFFRNAADRDAKIVPEELRLRELRETAELANRMIVSRREARRQFRESEERLRLLIESAPDAVMVHDAGGRIRQVNEMAALKLGHSQERLLEMNLRDIEVALPEAELAAMWNDLARGAVVSAEGLHRRADGKTFPVEVRAAPFFTREETLVVAFVRDISGRKAAEAALRESEERFRTIVQASPMGIHLYRLEESGRLILQDANPAADRILDLRHADLRGREITEAFPDWKNTEIPEIYRRIARSGGDFSDVAVRYRDDRIAGAFDTRAFQSAPGRVAVLFLDVTESQRAQEALRESEERFALALKGANDGLWDWNIKTGRIYFSPRWKEMLGYATEELPDDFDTWQGLIHPEDLPEAWRRYEDYMAGRTERFEMEFRMRRRDGGYAPILSRAFKQVDRAGAPVRLVGTHVDLTPLRRAEAEKETLEAQLRQSQKMEAVGQLAGGVAHDFNNLLQVINGHVDLALLDMAAEAAGRDHLEQVGRAGRRATRLVAQLLAFSRRQVMAPENLDINEVIGHLLTMLRRVIGEHIRLDFAPARREATIRGDRAMLEQALLNLCVNARDAMEAGGTLTLRTEIVELEPDFAAAHPWARPGRFVRLDAADTGCGMAPEVAERVFEPFFTTKETGKGTGLGLATVYGIVQQHKGMIQVRSEPGRGTAFSLYFPRIDEPARAEAGPAAGEVRGGSETILVAEDNDMVRELAVTLLERAGYAVVAVPDGAEAMETFRAEPDRFDLLLLDVVMPRAGGREVFADARAVRPEIPALFASGYNENALHTNFVLDAGLRLVRKPFTQPELLGGVREALDAAGKNGREAGGGT